LINKTEEQRNIVRILALTTIMTNQKQKAKRYACTRHPTMRSKAN
jgi:hypothetical protein